MRRAEQAIRYYASFVVQYPGDEKMRHYHGIVDVRRRACSDVGLEEVASALSHSLDLPPESLAVLHWSRLH